MMIGRAKRKCSHVDPGVYGSRPTDITVLRLAFDVESALWSIPARLQSIKHPTKQFRYWERSVGVKPMI